MNFKTPKEIQNVPKIKIVKSDDKPAGNETPTSAEPSPKTKESVLRISNRHERRNSLGLIDLATAANVLINKIEPETKSAVVKKNIYKQVAFDSFRKAICK